MTYPAHFLHPRNLITYFSALCGVIAILEAHRGSPLTVSGALIALSVIADSVDGSFARLFRRSPIEAQFGVQLDSFVDAFCFGAVPFVVWIGALQFSSLFVMVLWTCCSLLYLVAAITRLIFYNLHHAEERHFIGLPSNVAALTCASAYAFPLPAVVSATILAMSGVAMVAPIRVPRATGPWLVLFLCWPLALIVTGVFLF